MKYHLTEIRSGMEGKEKQHHENIEMADSSSNTSKSHIEETIVDLLEDEQQSADKVKTIQKTRENFIKLASENCKGHTKAANFYNVIFITLNLLLTLLTAFATVLSTHELPNIDDSAVPIITGLATIISAVIGFFKPADRRNKQLEFAKEIKVLMFRMIECESEEKYNEIWKEFYGALMTEPLMREKYRREANEMLGKMKWPIKAKFKNDILLQHGLSVAAAVNDIASSASSPSQERQPLIPKNYGTAAVKT